MGIFPDNYVSASENEAGPSRYFKLGKLKDGEATTIRLCGTFASGHALCGYGYFTAEGRPRRFPTFPRDFLDDIGLSYEGKTKNTGEKDKPSFFLSWVCLRKEAEDFQIIDISQKKVREQIEAILGMEDYSISDGEMANFYLTIKRAGTGLDTNYTVVPTLKVAAKADQQRWSDARSGIYLPAIYEGGDPFAGPPAGGEAPISATPLTQRDDLGADRELLAAGACEMPSSW
jgi:hypothetical protein